MQGVNQADVGMTVDPAANANTVYIAYKSPNAATTPPAVQAIPNFQTLEEGNFNPGNPIGDVPPTSGNEGHSSNNAGTIAGAVVGSVVGLALILGLLIYFLKKHRKSRTREFESLRGGEKSQSSSAAAWPFVGNGGNATSSPVKQYGDIGNVSSIRPVDVNAAELEALEPTSPMADGAVVLGGLYQFTRESPAFLDQQQTRIPKYAMRGIVYQNGGETYTLHYFITSTRDAFIKNVTTTVALANSSRVIQHRDAIAMSHPTRRSGYQYLWITEPCLPQQSLHYVLTGSDKSIDIHEYPFKAWSTYAMLEALKEVHAANFVHLGLTPYSFYYTDPEQVSDWKITGFDQSHSIGERVSEAHLNQWSAPELFATASRDNRRCYRQTVQPASDIWSLGCIIYTLATGRSLTIDLSQTAQLSRSDREQLYAHVNIACNEAGSVNDSYRTLLEGMLHPDPAKRNTAANLAAYWKEANGLYDDDEEENNEAEESIVTP
ncbi:kinase-like domain-containing protein [Phascolomyces articulosus]|uniref:Kinase-like domain-containing protein n=1 Tax=Phascolomyces articulosus TaxID=60185 RepID=A0AAD5KBL9_9FUNG|nr:kinase-like domain-containing protein [Phascolomyces articulosus]